MNPVNRGKLEALLIAVEEGSTLTRNAITAITRGVLASETTDKSGEPQDEADDPARPQRAARSYTGADVSAYGRELINEGTLGLRQIIVLTKEHFGLTLCELAAVMGLAHSTLSKYLNHGRCRAAVLAAAAELWGDPSGRNVGSGVTAACPDGEPQEEQADN